MSEDDEERVRVELWEAVAAECPHGLSAAAHRLGPSPRVHTRGFGAGITAGREAIAKYERLHVRDRQGPPPPAPERIECVVGVPVPGYAGRFHAFEQVPWRMKTWANLDAENAGR